MTDELVVTTIHCADYCEWSAKRMDVRDLATALVDAGREIGRLRADVAEVTAWYRLALVRVSVLSEDLARERAR